MQLNPLAPDNSAWNEAALHALGASSIAWAAGGPIVQPSIDLTGYAAAVTKAAKASLSAYANAKQWELAVGGFTTTVAGVARTFPTDPESQGLITAKAVRMGQANPPTTVNWQFANGFVTLAGSDFMAAAIAIADFVQATFDALKVVLAAIQSGSITDAAGVDAAAWPANHQ